MKIKDIYNFLEGNTKFYLSKLIKEPKHIQEQRAYRLLQCKDDCVIQGECQRCGCPVVKKIFNDKECGSGRYPDIMDNIKWEQFKKDNGID